MIFQQQKKEIEMTPYETAISGLAAALGTELDISSDRLCDVEVDGRLILLRPMGETESSITMFALVATVPEHGEQAAEIKTRALSMNLFGADTLGGHLGLFVGSLVLSAPPIEAVDLDAESFAESLLAFSRFAGEVEKRLMEPVASGAEPEKGVAVPSAEDGFIAV